MSIENEPTSPFQQPTAPQEPSLRDFSYATLPAPVQEFARPFMEIASAIVMKLQPGDERLEAMDALLVAREAVLHAAVEAGTT